MARVALTVQELEGDALSTNGLLATLNAGDAVDGNKFPWTGREILIAYNSDGSNPYDITINGPADRNGRTGDITQELAVGAFAVFGPGNGITEGWRQSDGQLYCIVENAAVKLIVLRLPQN